jgi:uncharacterized protein YndB with AHSA1/START domain
MRSILKGIIIAAVGLIVVVIGGAYLIPEDAVVERATTIAAPPEKVFAIVGNMKRFNEWSPWSDLDPATAYTYEGPETGAGQKMSWVSTNPNVGAGSMTITDMAANERILLDLDFGDMGKSQSTWAFAPADGGTAVVWGFRMKANGIVERWMSLMFDRWIGADYEKGLSRLKALAEKENTGG